MSYPEYFIKYRNDTIEYKRLNQKSEELLNKRTKLDNSVSKSKNDINQIKILIQDKSGELYDALYEEMFNLERDIKPLDDEMSEVDTKIKDIYANKEKLRDEIRKGREMYLYECIKYLDIKIDTMYFTDPRKGNTLIKNAHKRRSKEVCKHRYYEIKYQLRDGRNLSILHEDVITKFIKIRKEFIDDITKLSYDDLTTIKKSMQKTKFMCRSNYISPEVDHYSIYDEECKCYLNTYEFDEFLIRHLLNIR